MELPASLEGQAQVWSYMFAFVDSMAVKCAVELRIADIIHSHGASITLSKIASSINAPNLDIHYLTRIMRLLVRRNIFTADQPSTGGEILYGLTHVSKWLLRDSEFSLAPMILYENHPWAIDPWHFLSPCVKEGGIAFKKTHGFEVFEFASKNPEFNKLQNDAMACTAKITAATIVEEYKDGFGGIGSLIDVGGGTGNLIAKVVKSFPHIKGINFDLPHVVAAAPKYEGVSHVEGDMFDAIPCADAVIMKWVLHDWSDELCVKILKNCRKAIQEKNGKVIIVDVVLEPEGKNPFDDARMFYDLVMIAHCSGGKERTEFEWKILLEEAGFPCYKIIKLPALLSIIEAYPKPI